MSDEVVAALLDSEEPLVVIEAAAGCGKTYQGAGFAKRAAAQLRIGRVLILTHTHAACGVFAKETKDQSQKAEIRTIDSLIVQIASAYHCSLDLPPDPYSWARHQGGNSFDELGKRVARLLWSHSMISQMLVNRYPIVICDEHQDSSAAQHSIIMSLHRAGARIRIFGDPMQRIYGDKTQAAIAADRTRWEGLKSDGADNKLEFPHRWRTGSPGLGNWIIQARETLKEGGRIDLSGQLPAGLQVLCAENTAHAHAGYQLSTTHRRPLDQVVNSKEKILVLTGRNETTKSLRVFWNRRMPIWEGHTREALGELAAAINIDVGDAVPIGRALISFLGEVAVGFSPSSHGNRLIQELGEGCVKKSRGKPVHIQQLGRFVLEDPNHIGVGKFLRHLTTLMEDKIEGFEAIKIDHRREYGDAVHLMNFDDPEEGLSEIGRRRSFVRPEPPAKAISTIHKAKGLECDNAVIVPLDGKGFSNTDYSRCKLYVALSRAKQSLTLVVSRDNPSPLIELG